MSTLAALPHNPITAKRYHGKNLAKLLEACEEFGFCGQFATYKQWLSAGRVVRKGQKAAARLYYINDPAGDTDSKGQKVADHQKSKRPLRSFSVFALEQTEELPEGDDTPKGPTPKGPTTEESKADRIRAKADRLEAQANAKLAPRPENTPRRQREAGTARLGGHRMQRAAAYLRAWADAAEAGTLPPELIKPPTKAEALAAAAKPCDCSRTGYYDAPMEVADPDAWGDTSPRAMSLRDLAGFDRAKAEEQAQEAAKAAELAELRRSDFPGFFPTPEPLGRRMIKLARLNLPEVISRPGVEPATMCERGSLEGLTVLDPSCGIGSLLDLAAEAGADCYGVEVVPKLADFCRRHGRARTVECRDFLDHGRMGTCEGHKWAGFLSGSGIVTRGADVVLMNPPFEKGAAPRHVRLAYRFLASGGVLVAVMPAGVRACCERGQDGNTHLHRFEDWLHDLDHEWHDVEPAAFASARDAFRQTGVAVDLLVIRKP